MSPVSLFLLSLMLMLFILTRLAPCQFYHHKHVTFGQNVRQLENGPGHRKEEAPSLEPESRVHCRELLQYVDPGYGRFPSPLFLDV